MCVYTWANFRALNQNMITGRINQATGRRHEVLPGLEGAKDELFTFQLTKREKGT